MACLTLSVKIPEGVNVSLQGSSITVSGPKGTITKDFAHSGLKFTKTEEAILLSTSSRGKR
ncbi:MAG: hypothetical protein QXN86_04210, partial [Candidatus Methanomethylicaceae archaeon]